MFTFCSQSWKIFLSLGMSLLVSTAYAKNFPKMNLGPSSRFETTTPIKYLVVILPENCSFDHYFATYPVAKNQKTEPPFFAKPHTSIPNNLLKTGLLKHNTNLFNPFRLSRAQAKSLTVINGNPKHTYKKIQQAAHAGLLDHFVETNPTIDKLVMSFYDGNTVTALWNYAQRFAMSDNFFSTNFGPSTPGHINIISGQTHGAEPPFLTDGKTVYTIEGTLIEDPDPLFDQCSSTPRVEMTGRNIGDLLNAKNITWGWFQGGFRNCDQSHIGSNGVPVNDYVPHHAAFQYYRSTSNPKHKRPSSISKIGFSDRAKHQYDLTDFWAAIENGNMPAVSFLKPPAYQNGHPKNSDPLALQTFLVETINALQQLDEWPEMAILLLWDDSGGWYDHVMPPIINESQTTEDALVSPGNAGDRPPMGGYQARLAYGMRIPFIVISPFAKSNYISHSLADQTSVLRFIEDNWDLGRIGDFSFDRLAAPLDDLFDFIFPKRLCRLILDPDTGTPFCEWNGIFNPIGKKRKKLKGFLPYKD